MVNHLAVTLAWRMAHSIARMHDETRVDRSHFGIGEAEWSDGSVIGLDVQVVVDLVLEPAGESSWNAWQPRQPRLR